MNYKSLLWLMVCLAIMTGCCQEQSERIVEKIVEKSTLQDIVDSANDGDTIDLSQYSDLRSYSAAVNKTLTIKNGSLSNSTLTVEANDVTLSGLKDLKVTTSAKLADGKLTINDSVLSDLLLCGGGSNSIYIMGKSSVTNLTMDYSNVRTLLGGDVSVANLNVKQDAIIQAETGKTVKVDNLKLEGFSSLANVGGGTQDSKAGGVLDIENINFTGENAQMNLNGEIKVGNIASDSTSKIITNNNKLDIADKNISIKNTNAALTIVKNGEMQPLNLLVLGLEDCYIIGDELQKSKIIVMEENQLTGDAVIYKQGVQGAETINKVWIKKTDFEIKINGNDNLKFTNAGTAKVTITCGKLTYTDDIPVMNPNEPLGDVTINLKPKEPQISLYIDDDGQGYKKLNNNSIVNKPNNANCVLMAIADIPDNYTVDKWYLNSTVLSQSDIVFNGVMLTLPMSNIANYLVSEKNTISVTVKDSNNYLSGNVTFNYVVE